MVAQGPTGELPEPHAWLTRRHRFLWWVRLLTRMGLLSASIAVAVWHEVRQINRLFALAIIPLTLSSIASMLPWPGAKSVQLREIPFLGPTAWGIHFSNTRRAVVIHLAGLAGFATVTSIIALRLHPQARYEELSKYSWVIPGGYVLQQIWRGLPAGSLALTPTTIVQQHLHGTPTFEVAWSNVKEIRAESKRGE